MSTGLDCRFEHVPSGWYYLLESYEDRDEYDAYGPFPSFAAAEQHLDDNHANPGGYSSPPADGAPREPSPRMAAMLAHALPPR